MRILIELIIFFFALLTIYRRLIRPFVEGIGGKAKPNDQSGTSQSFKFNSASSKKNSKHVDQKEIQDAEFKEIK